MTISSTTGLYSGIDYQAIIDKLTSLNERPITILQSKQTKLNNQSTALGTISSVLTTLNTQISSMLSAKDLASVSASSSDKNYLTVTADSTASIGSYSIDVLQLAKAAKTVSSTVAAKTSAIASGSGNFAITVGSVTKTYEVTSSTTLQDLVDTINADSTGKVTASIVNTGDSTNPYSLVLKSKTTGTANDITISDNGTNLTFTNTAGQDAKISVDGMTVTRSTNTFEDVVAGVTFTAVKVTEDSVTANVTRDSSALQTSINSFVTDYNAVMSQIKTLTAYNSSTETGGILMGNSAVRDLRNSLARMVTGSVSGLSGDYNSFVSIGLSVDKSGTLSFDSTKFNKALTADAASVQAIFGRLGNAASSEVKFVASTTSTTTGTYTLNVTQAATRASVSGTQTLTSSGLTSAENLTFTVGDTSSSTSKAKTFTVALSAGDTLDQIITKLNKAFSSNSVSYTASSDNGVLQIQSDSYGSKQIFSVTSDQAASTSGQLGIGTTAVSSTGKDVLATMDGISLKGSGQTLTGVTGTKFAGLELTITATSTLTTKVNLTNGVANQMSNFLKNYLDSSTGIITLAQSSLSKSVTSIDSTIERIQKRVDAEAVRLKKQFTALEKTLANYSSIQNYITAISKSTSSSSSKSS